MKFKKLLSLYAENNRNIPTIQYMDKAYIERFETELQHELLQICCNHGMLNGMLLASDDIDSHWLKIGPEYLADAVIQIKDYPTVSVAWAAYIGMGVACEWDSDWERCQHLSYQHFYGTDGFDNMDEHIVNTILGIPTESEAARKIETTIRSCAQATVSRIRHEGIEPQSPTAYYVFASACKSMYRIGAALELKRLDYKFEKIDLPANRERLN